MKLTPRRTELFFSLSELEKEFVMVKPTLLVLAAGMGSRYGSLKQMDGVGPSGEAIIDYSIYDAIRAGFGKVVFVIRHLFEKEFREIFTPERFGGKIEDLRRCADA